MTVKKLLCLAGDNTSIEIASPSGDRFYTGYAKDLKLKCFENLYHAEEIGWKYDKNRNIYQIAIEKPLDCMRS